MFDIIGKAFLAKEKELNKQAREDSDNHYLYMMNTFPSLSSLMTYESEESSLGSSVSSREEITDTHITTMLNE